MALSFTLPAQSAGDCEAPPVDTTPRYELIEIDVIGFEPNVETQGRFGINNRGEIAYTRKVDGQYRAMLWLPQDAYGFDTTISHTIDLVDVFGPTPPETEGFLSGSSYARDIGDGGFLVGQFGGTTWFEGTAFVIDLADHFGWPNRSFEWKPATITAPCTSAWARAMAVTGDEDPVVVVEIGHEAECLSAGCAPNFAFRCFPQAGLLSNIGSTSPDHAPLDQFACPGVSGGDLPSTYAFDIERALAGPSLLYAGKANRLSAEVFCPIDAGDGCWEPSLALRWDPSAQSLESLSVEYHPVARGLNRIGDTVGFGLLQPGTGMGACKRHAALWPGGGTSAIDLHDSVAPVVNESQAEAVNRFGWRTQVVGWDQDLQRPLLWIKEGPSSWPGWILQVGGGTQFAIIECDDCNQSPSVIVLREAFDINDHGWIVAWGERTDVSPTSEKFRLYLLKPIDICRRPGDLDQSGEVNLTDLTFLLGSWGDCEHLWCPADLTGDGKVDLSDLLVLLANWGPCHCDPQGLPQSLQDCIQRVGLDPTALSACLSAIP